MNESPPGFMSGTVVFMADGSGIEYVEILVKQNDRSWYKARFDGVVNHADMVDVVNTATYHASLNNAAIAAETLGSVVRYRRMDMAEVRTLVASIPSEEPI